MTGKHISFTKKTNIAFYAILFLFSFVSLELAYLNYSKSMSEKVKNEKKSFVRLTGLPDLAISSKSSFIRHRSLSDTFSIYSIDSTLREYSELTFAILPREIN